MDHFNKLTPAEAERLAMLAEECGEVIQVVGKILRHGFESYHPNDLTSVTNIGGAKAFAPKPGAKSNRDLLTEELSDLFAVVEMMDADFALIDAAAQEAAFVKKMRYAHHQV